MITRRRLLETGVGAALVVPGLPWLGAAALAQGRPKLSPLLPEGTRSEAIFDTLPGKKPLIKLTYRPPNYETPVEYFRSVITPNDAFFVRYHLSDIPEVDAGSWKLKVGGEGANAAIEIGLDELRRLPAFEIAAVCMCAGNRRGLFQPHVPGVQWSYGAMGCARWKGARLKDVLDKAGVKSDAIEIAFDGTDGPVVDKTPDFIKSLPVWKALEETTLLAYEMNGLPLPHWNGFPVRLVVPGWAATYWVKHVTSIDVSTKPFDGFWMKSAYRIPVGKFPVVARFISQETATNTPITEIVVNSLITSPDEGASVKPGRPVNVSGIAWDGGYGMLLVEVSTDGGKTWVAASLGQDVGRFAFRAWSHAFSPPAPGKYAIMARATNKIGQTQTPNLILNPAGYHHNVIQSVTIVAT